MKYNPQSNSQSGAVSIFVVVFAALLLSIITVGFVRLMVADQQRATNSDLSQSAYDSAQTGVEDVKRALLRYQNDCQTLGPAVCATSREALTTDVCNAAVRDGSADTGEVLIQQSIDTDAKLLDQAYTCVKVKLDTPDYLGSIGKDESALIPLITSKVNPENGEDLSPEETTFNEVTIEWFNSKDTNGATAVDVPADATDGKAQPMVEQAKWLPTRPALMRVGLMQYGSSFTLSDFDGVKEGGFSNAHTLFLYPTLKGAEATEFKIRDPRQAYPETTAAGLGNAPLPTKCSDTISGEEANYSCSMKLTVPEPINPTTQAGNKVAYLRLTALYNFSHFRITLSKDGKARSFSDVQASVDSTGRANELFRRIQSRVNLVDTSFPYPDAALDVGGDICKNFSVTDTENFPGAIACTP